MKSWSSDRAGRDVNYKLIRNPHILQLHEAGHHVSCRSVADMVNDAAYSTLDSPWMCQELPRAFSSSTSAVIFTRGMATYVVSSIWLFGNQMKLAITSTAYKGRDVTLCDDQYVDMNRLKSFFRLLVLSALLNCVLCCTILFWWHCNYYAVLNTLWFLCCIFLLVVLPAAFSFFNTCPNDVN